MFMVNRCLQSFLVFFVVKCWTEFNLKVHVTIHGLYESYLLSEGLIPAKFVGKFGQ